jgi:hypothetical protein
MERDWQTDKIKVCDGQSPLGNLRWPQKYSR